MPVREKVCVCVHMHYALCPLWPQSPGKSVGFLGAAVTGDCELPSVGTEKCTWVFWKQK